MITATQMRAARALLGSSLTKVIEAFDQAGVILLGENVPSQGGGCGVRLKGTSQTAAETANLS